jgi:hypothetical protein
MRPESTLKWRSLPRECESSGRASTMAAPGGMRPWDFEGAEGHDKSRESGSKNISGRKRSKTGLTSPPRLAQSLATVATGLIADEQPRSSPSRLGDARFPVGR